MNTFIIIILFYLFLSLISFVIVYANDTADIAHGDFERTREPSLLDLPEEDRTNYCEVDHYIKNTICPRYHHRILKNEIDYYQKDESSAGSFGHFFMFNLVLSMLPIKIVRLWGFFPYLVAFILGLVCHFVVWLLYNKYSTYRIKDYYEIHTSYDWESHYNYLCSNKKNIIFRHTLRNFITYSAILCYLLFLFICMANND